MTSAVGSLAFSSHDPDDEMILVLYLEDNLWVLYHDFIARCHQSQSREYHLDLFGFWRLRKPVNSWPARLETLEVKSSPLLPWMTDTGSKRVIPG